jgi:steroid delta-isomerase-like uncharacterized protein
MSEANKATIRSLYDALNSGDLGAFASLIADDVVEHEELPGLTPDKNGVIQFFQGCLSAFEGFRIDPEDIFAEGDRVTARCFASGKHVGEFIGIPASGNSLHVGVADYFRVEDGKVKEHWGVMDTGAMLQQMGAIPH